MSSSDATLALAFDLGTTTIAASLLDRKKSLRLAATGSFNPQREFGADVVSRLQAATASAANRERLRLLISTELERLAVVLLDQAGASLEDVSLLAIAGNPAMEHLLLGLPVDSLAHPPYRPLFTGIRTLRTRDLGWSRDVDAVIFPLPGGFVGGDMVAFLHGVGVASTRNAAPRLYLDFGTNGEMALVAGETIYATSAAAGPAFEGGNLSCGMVALPGAINRVRIEGEHLSLGTIGDMTPVGICGSAVIETTAELLRHGLMDRTGRLIPAVEVSSNLANRLQTVAGDQAFVLYRDARRTVFLSQADIRQVQLAKAAVRAGMEILFQRSGLPAESLQEVVLTGSFGAELDPFSLKRIGIFTESMVKIARFVSDGALAGVEKALLHPEGMAAVSTVAQAMKVIPLSGTPTFEKLFIEQLNFPLQEN